VGSYQQLEVYRRSVQLGDRVWRVTRVTSEWESWTKWTVGLQLMRAVDSIAANIAEGYGRKGC
jgi:four helix bundle protein